MELFRLHVLKDSVFCVDVNHGVVDSFVAEEFFDVYDVFGFVIFHCRFPMSESVGVNHARLKDNVLFSVPTFVWAWHQLFYLQVFHS